MEDAMKTLVMTTRVAPVAARPTRQLAGLPKLVRDWIEISKQRRALAEMSDHQLQDIGLTRFQAEDEAARPFWDARN
jgi:uncharacterized protein YjiS (DUF1127 family)